MYTADNICFGHIRRRMRRRGKSRQKRREGWKGQKKEGGVGLGGGRQESKDEDLGTIREGKRRRERECEIPNNLCKFIFTTISMNLCSDI